MILWRQAPNSPETNILDQRVWHVLADAAQKAGPNMSQTALFDAAAAAFKDFDPFTLVLAGVENRRILEKTIENKRGNIDADVERSGEGGLRNLIGAMYSEEKRAEIRATRGWPEGRRGVGDFSIDLDGVCPSDSDSDSDSDSESGRASQR